MLVNDEYMHPKVLPKKLTNKTKQNNDILYTLFAIVNMKPETQALPIRSTVPKKSYFPPHLLNAVHNTVRGII